MKEQYRLVQEEALGRLSCVPKRHNCKVGLHVFLSMRQLWLFWAKEEDGGGRMTVSLCLGKIHGKAGPPAKSRLIHPLKLPFLSYFFDVPVLHRSTGVRSRETSGM